MVSGLRNGRIIAKASTAVESLLRIDLWQIISSFIQLFV